MSAADPDVTTRLRQGVYWILICVSAGLILGRILAVDSVDELGKEKYRIQERLQEERVAVQSDLNAKVEAVRKSGLTEAAQATKIKELEAAADEQLGDLEDNLQATMQLRRPFLSANDRSRWCTVRALVEPEMRVPGAPYAIDRVIQQPRWDTIDMVKFQGHLYSSKPPLLATLMAGQYWLIHKLTGATLFGEPYAIGRGMLVTFNLVPLIVYFWVLTRLVERFGLTDWGRIFVVAAGTLGTFLSTFAVVINNHLPGAVCAAIALWATLRIWCDGQRRLRYFVLAGFFGALMVTNELPSLALLALLSLVLLWQAPRPTLLAYVPAAAVVAAAFFATNWIAFQTLSPPYAHEEWYKFTYERSGKQYESYWLHPVGMDRGEPSKAIYAMHSLVGHHGVFALTPMWILSVAGALAWLRGKDSRLRLLAAIIAAVSLICIVFYVFMQSLHHRSYGGMSSGFRWLFWFAPLWLLVMLPAADWMARRRWTIAVALVLLVVSVLSVSYPTWNPWTNPWLLDFFDYLGWS